MRGWMIVMIVALAVGGFATNATAGDQVPSDMLAQMGLSGMQPMSDQEGMEVRGMGFWGGGSTASVWGTNTASFLGSSASNSYDAYSDPRHGSAMAMGGSSSTIKAEARISINTGSGHKPRQPSFNSYKSHGSSSLTIKANVKVQAYGGAWAWAK